MSIIYMEFRNGYIGLIKNKNKRNTACSKKNVYTLLYAKRIQYRRQQCLNQNGHQFETPTITQQILHLPFRTLVKKC